MINQRMYKNVVVLGIAGFALFLATSGALAFSASFAWCSGSPSFALTDVPQGTARLQFAMTDLNVPSFHHGGGTVAYSGAGGATDIIAAGATYVTVGRKRAVIAGRMPVLEKELAMAAPSTLLQSTTSYCALQIPAPLSWEIERPVSVGGGG